jgi:Ni,Fe-hydrogenase I cytochrome b subunit
MTRKDNLADRLVEQGGTATNESIEAQLARIQTAIHREGALLRRWLWITAGLWLAVFVLNIVGLAMSYNPSGESSGGSSAWGYLITIPLFICAISAPIATVVLIFRAVIHFVHQWGSGRREANLRLVMIEERLRRMEEASRQ